MASEHKTSPVSRVFVANLVIFGLAFAFLAWLFPLLAQIAVGAPNNLPVPSTLFSWYISLIGIAFFMWLSSDQETWESFLSPIIAAIRGRGGIYGICFKVIFVVLPLWVGFQVIRGFVPNTEVPAATRQQHPGMSGSGAAPYMNMQNPYRDPTPEMLAEFATWYEDDAPEPDTEELGDAWPIKRDIEELDDARLKELFFEHTVIEGRQLYQKNCRPCHGTGFDGAGPMAAQYKLRPVAFIDPGTIATLVEDSVFWRVSEGGIGLPMNATPWDSPMPKWGTELTEEERWKIITALYHDIDMKPRVLEMKVEQ